MKCWSAGSACLLGAVVAVGGLGLSGRAAAEPVTPGAAKQLYVKHSAASDPVCGAASQANPFRTIASALACARNGATVHIGAGHFAGGVSVAANVTLVGAGAATVIADPSLPADLVPEVTVASGRTVTLRKLHIDGADTAGNPAHAGVRSSAGTLTLRQVSISGAVAVGGAGLDAESSGGDIDVTVQDSTISGNLALQYGGAIMISGPGAGASTLNLLNSTISGNQANANGGGLYLSGATLNSRESSITANSASAGGGLYIQPTPTHNATLTGTLLAANTAAGANAGPDCLATAGAGVNLISGGHNLIGQDTGANATGCAGFTNNTHGDQVGTPTTPIDPVLAALADNGGATPTHAPLSGSPAIGTGNTADCQAAPIDDLDQRGKPRHTNTRNSCDIGAYDTGGTPLQALYVKHSAASDPVCGAASQANPFRTIASALACARNGATVHIGAGHFAGEVSVAANVTLVGAGAATVIADPSLPADLVPEVTVASGRTVTLRKLHIDGADTAGNPAHAGVRSSAGTLTLRQVSISGAVAVGGAGLDAESSGGDIDVTVQDSTISGNLALQYGGAIMISGPGAGASTLNLLNSTISGNQANANGGGLYLSGATLNSRESSITANSASAGGGLYIQPTPTHNATLTGTLLAANTAAGANAGPDCLATAGAGVNLISGGHNLIGQDTGANATGCAGFTNNSHGDQVGTPTTPIDPVLAALADNGGATPTHAPLSGSPAIGTGNTADCQAAPIDDLDQRGKPRHTNTRNSCDIGAYDTGGAA